MASQRVTITLPADVVRDIDERERNRSKFILEAVRHELERRRRDELRRSLRNPHPESEDLAALGTAGWIEQAVRGDETLLDQSLGRKVRWTAGQGWVEVDE